MKFLHRLALLPIISSLMTGTATQDTIQEAQQLREELPNLEVLKLTAEAASVHTANFLYFTSKGADAVVAAVEELGKPDDQ